MRNRLLLLAAMLLTVTSAQAETLLWPKKVDAIAKSYGCSQPKDFYRATSSSWPPFAVIEDNLLVFWCQNDATGEYQLRAHLLKPEKNPTPGCGNLLETGAKYLGGIELRHIQEGRSDYRYAQDIYRKDYYMVHGEAFVRRENGQGSERRIPVWVCEKNGWHFEDHVESDIDTTPW